MSHVKNLATIERCSDGLYSVHSESHFGNSYFGGYGDSVEKAKEDFIESIKEAIMNNFQKLGMRLDLKM